MATRRQRYQATPTGYLSQVRDPVTGRRVTIRASSLGALEARQRRVRDLRDDLRQGHISVREAEGQLRPAVGTATTVADLWSRYLPGVPPASRRIAESVWRHQLAPWFAGALVWDLSETKMRAWRTDLERVPRKGGKKRGYSPKTRRHAFDFLRAALALAIRDGVLSEYPWGTFSVPNPKAPENERESFRDATELVAILSAARAWDTGHKRALDGRFPALIVLALTGMRQAEAAGLGWDDLTLDREPYLVLIRHQARRGWPRVDGGDRPLAPPKGGVMRSQILHPNAAAALLHHRRLLRGLGRYAPDGPVFPRPGTAKWRTSGWVLSPRAFRDLVGLAGLPNVPAWTTHSTRHGFSRLELIGHGGDLRTVAERTGHKDLTILEGYLRKAATRDGQGASKIPELPLFLGPPALEAHGAASPEHPSPTEHPPPLLECSGDPGPDAETDAEREPNADSRWAALARAWIAEGRPGERPRAVTLAIKGIYSRGHSREMRASGDRAKARALGQRMRRAALGAWARVLARALTAQTP